MPDYRRAKLAIYLQLNKDAFPITPTQMLLLSSFVCSSLTGTSVASTGMTAGAAVAGVVAEERSGGVTEVV